MCGIVGMVSSSPVNQQIYDALGLLQHRGQDSTGIATLDGQSFSINKAKGQVREAYRTRDMRRLSGNTGLGHVRYATRGKAKREEEAQPFYVNSPFGIVLVHNGTSQIHVNSQTSSTARTVVTSIRPRTRSFL